MLVWINWSINGTFDGGFGPPDPHGTMLLCDKHIRLLTRYLLLPWTTTLTPRVCPIFRGFICPKSLYSEALWGGYVPKILWSESPLFRRSFGPKVVIFRRFHIPSRPTIWILCYEHSLVRSSSSPMGALFWRFHIPKNRPSTIRVLYYESSLVQSSSCLKAAMFRRFYFPNIAEQHSFVQKFERYYMQSP